MNPEPCRSLEEARNLDFAGKHDEALAAFRGFLNFHPEATQGWVDFAGLLMVHGRLEEARQACDTALRLEPRHYGALVHSACVLMHQGHLDDSEVLFRDAIAMEPGRRAGRLMLSDTLVRKDDLNQARTLLEDVLKETPGDPIALDRLNTVMVCQGDWAGLRKDMERQLLNYSGAEAEYVASHLDLMFGDMPQGWHRSESRLEIPGRKPLRSYPQPRWQGEPFAGKTLLLTWEQGFGDTLMFIRYAPMAKALGGRVLLEVQPNLVEIASTCPGIDEVLPHGHPLPPFDLHASLLSIPSIFATTLDSIPADIPYLSVPPTVPDQEEIHRLLEAGSGRTRIGVCWAGNAQHPRDSKRSLPPIQLGALGAIPDVAWYSFQFATTESSPLPNITPMGALLQSGGFPNTAYALQGMDLVIAVDTVLAHLAGAMGIPTFLLLSFIPDWRWMMGQDHSPWYPTLRIYRQPRPGDWDSVLLQVVRDLSNLEAT